MGGGGGVTMGAESISFFADLQRRSFAGASAATSDSLAADRRLAPEQVAQFLDERQYATIATTRRDGRPHAAMSAFIWFQDAAWLPVMAGTARARNLGSTPFASMVVAEEEGPLHVMVLVEGEASIVPEPAVGLDAAWKTKFGWAPDWADAWIRIAAKKILSYAGDASRFAPPARERQT
jgi:general stress protein 26